MPKKFLRRRKAPAKTKKDKQQDRAISKIARSLKEREVKSLTFSSSADVAYIQGTNAIAYGQLTSTIAQGTTIGQRVGNKVEVFAMKIYFSAYDDQTIHNYARFMIMKNAGDYSATIPGLDVLANYSTTDANYHNAISPHSHEMVKMRQVPDSRKNPYTIYFDKTFHIQPMYSFTAGQTTDAKLINMTVPQSTKQFYQVNKWIKFKTPIVPTWDSAGNPGANHLQLVILPGRSTTDTSNPFIQYSVTTYFRDP